MEENKLKISKNTVVHCETEKEAITVLKIAHESGYSWLSRRSFIQSNYWDIYKYNTGYWLLAGEFANIDYYINIGKKIISAQEFINLHNN